MALELKPYKETDVPWERSKGLITAMLMEHGATGVQWTDIFDRWEIDFRFAYRIRDEEQGIEEDIGVHITVPIRKPVKKDRYGDIIELSEKDRRKAYNQAYRAVYWWMKSQFEAVAFGIQRLDQVFMSNMMYKLPSGQMTTVYEAFKAGIIQKAEFQLETGKVEVLPPANEDV